MNELKYIEFIEIEKTEADNEHEYVYDLSVEEDESFNVDSIFVHNSGCITSSNTSIHYPMASLIEECYEIKQRRFHGTKIIADGGMSNYSDVIKALALGADGVMCGKLFSQCIETPGAVYLVDRGEEFNDNNLPSESCRINQFDYDLNNVGKSKKLVKHYFGMASKFSQKQMGRETMKTSEGTSKYIEVKYTLKGWLENLKDYLQSAMSYTNSKTLKELRKCDIILLSNNATNGFNK